MPEAPVALRPHHVLCAIGFEGKGYSSRFVANMAGIVAGLRADPARRVRIVGATDAICGPCPKRRGALCTSQPRIAALDARHAAALDLAEGDELSWAEATGRVAARVGADDLDTLCRGCAWLEQGMCKRAVAALPR